MLVINTKWILHDTFNIIILYVQSKLFVIHGFDYFCIIKNGGNGSGKL